MGRTKGSDTGAVWFVKDKSGKKIGARGKFILPNGQIKHFYGANKREVQQQISVIKREVEAGLHGNLAAEQTLREAAIGYLASRPNLAQKTRANYQSIISNHLDVIGEMPLSQIHSQHIQDHYTRKLNGREASTVQKIHNFVHLVFKRAVKLRVLPSNPASADYVEAPSSRNKEFTPLNAEQAIRLLESIRTERLYPLYTLAIYTGMRISEILGLTWDQVDFQHEEIKIVRQLIRDHEKNAWRLDILKTKNSRREIPLAAQALAALWDWKEQQEKEKRLLGEEAWGNSWDLTFTTQAGTPIYVSMIDRHFDLVLKRAKLPDIRFHDLRHTFATTLLERGVQILAVSELLGHASIEITLKVYGHYTPKMREQATNEIHQLYQSEYSNNHREMVINHRKNHHEEEGHSLMIGKSRSMESDVFLCRGDITLYQRVTLHH